MSVQQLLQQLLQSGKSLSQDAGSRIKDHAPGLGSNFGGFGGGALAGGALGLLLGNKKFRKMGGTLATYGGVAALGAVALKAYQDWQTKQSASGAATAMPPSQQAQHQAPLQTTQPLPLSHQASPAVVPTAEIEQHSRAILSAMIAAAKADGHIGDQERQMIDAEIAKLSNNPSDMAWFDAELKKPADPAEVAALATTPEIAAEIYLASLLVIEDGSFMERAYLDELGRKLALPNTLQAELRAQVQQLSAVA
jgi:uncharacterized membrane protein YebE (DUF533 family)